ncbi:hypothetical protein ARMGADRAFT_1031229 [Armillaria gallica]|uniref:Uncharacterized protein n=1 Tax=Armillaria gallica TaxID=47427 RepID=A0A2H3DEZ3_ARMGA|nr:hypothetical protein ARMGADRAFT_1031229 [Armillaria gallica]
MSASRVISATLANLIDCLSTWLDVMSQGTQKGGQLSFFGPDGPTYLPTRCAGPTFRHPLEHLGAKNSDYKQPNKVKGAVTIQSQVVWCGMLPEIERPSSLNFLQMSIPHCPLYPAYGVQNA